MLNGRIVVATPYATSADYFGAVFAAEGWLRLYLAAVRNLPSWSEGRGRRLLPMAVARSLNERYMRPERARMAVRYGLLPLFDRWVSRQLEPGDWMLSSFGYVVDAFRRVRAAGGHTLVDSGNSHPEHYRALMREETERWGGRRDPVPAEQYERNLAMLEQTDLIFCPSHFVRDSYLQRGFAPERLAHTNYPVRLDLFQPAPEPPPPRPFRVLCTADCCLRKGTPYLLDAFDRLRRAKVDVELILPDRVGDDVRDLVEPLRNRITWFAPMPHARLAELLRSCHAFVLPSIEEGLARSGLEAMATGIPVLATANTGLADYIRDGENGLLIPLRDGTKLAEALQSLAEDPAKARALGEAARATAAELAPTRFHERVAASLRAFATSMQKDDLPCPSSSV